MVHHSRVVGHLRCECASRRVVLVLFEISIGNFKVANLISILGECLCWVAKRRSPFLAVGKQNSCLPWIRHRGFWQDCANLLVCIERAQLVRHFGLCSEYREPLLFKKHSFWSNRSHIWLWCAAFKSELGESRVSFSARLDFMMLPWRNRCFDSLDKILPCFHLH